MASPQADGIKAMMRAQRAEAVDRPPPASIEEVRSYGDNLALLSTEPDGITVEPADAGGVPGIWVTPGAPAEGRVLLYLHGGGYVIGSSGSHRKLCGHLANATRLRILSIDYALAPERPHPAAVTDAVTAYRWLLEQGHDPAGIAIAGDSAGGGLTVATLVKLRDEGVPLPAAAVTMSPWTDMTQSFASYEANAGNDLMLGREALAGMVAMFLAGTDPEDPYASPVFADLSGLPPLYVQVGDEECLLDDSRELAARAEAAGVEVRLDVFPEMQHVFQLWAGNAPEADDALARVGDWLRPRLRR